MNKEKMVEDLAKVIDNFVIEPGDINTKKQLPTLTKNRANTIADVLVRQYGYIPKSMALELVKICPDCKGLGRIPWVAGKHKRCKGRGIVLREGGK